MQPTKSNENFIIPLFHTADALFLVWRESHAAGNGNWYGGWYSLAELVKEAEQFAPDTEASLNKVRANPFF